MKVHPEKDLISWDQWLVWTIHRVWEPETGDCNNPVIRCPSLLWWLGSLRDSSQLEESLRACCWGQWRSVGASSLQAIRMPCETFRMISGNCGKSSSHLTGSELASPSLEASLSYFLWLPLPPSLSCWRNETAEILCYLCRFWRNPGLYLRIKSLTGRRVSYPQIERALWRRRQAVVPCMRNAFERNPFETTDQEAYDMSPGTWERAVHSEETGELESEEDWQK